MKIACLLPMISPQPEGVGRQPRYLGLLACDEVSESVNQKIIRLAADLFAEVGVSLFSIFEHSWAWNTLTAKSRTFQLHTSDPRTHATPPLTTPPRRRPGWAEAAERSGAAGAHPGRRSVHSRSCGECSGPRQRID